MTQNANKQDTIYAYILGLMFVLGIGVLVFFGTNPIDSMFEQQYDPNVEAYQEYQQDAELQSISQ